MKERPATQPERFYITTPIYYVNARPHLGHAYSTIVCDAIARSKRAQGIETWFLTGTDEHGQKIERSAEQAGRTPAEFAAAISGEFRALWSRLNLTNDDFIRTTEERHKRGVQKLFAELRDRGFIYKGSYSGQYCVSDELYVDAPPGSPCPDCGRPTETVSEENYFFKLSAFERRLLEYYEAHPEFIQPEARRNEVIAFVRGGLKDLSVSRTSFRWGIPVPGDEKHVIYVWMDALANYITALGYGSDDPADQERFRRFWPADMHLIGKEISRFHCVYWPAFLMAAGLPLPKSVVANGWLLFDKSKMSKSIGNIVRAETVAEVLGADALRYFLLREITFGQDGNFTFESLVQRYNGDLANGYGNLVSRVVAMMHRYFDGKVPEAMEAGDAERALQAAAESVMASYPAQFEARDFSRALETLWGLVAAIDGYLTAAAPWKKPPERSEDDHRPLQARVLGCAAEAIRVVTALAWPILPESAAKVWRQLGLGDLEQAAQTGKLKTIEWGGLRPGTIFAEPAALFPRAEKDAIERMLNLENENNLSAVAAVSQTSAESAAVPHAPAKTADATVAAEPEKAKIAIEDFARVELRVAQVLVAERVPKSDKLLRLEVDLGDEKRQILAGIAQHYEPEKLIGRKVVIVANLAPRKMRGLESNGMIVAASVGDEGAPVLAGFLEDVPVGARLK